MKIAHIVCSLNIGGAERFVIDLCNTQKCIDLNPAVISLGQVDDLLIDECRASNILVACYGGSSIIKICRVFLVLLKFDCIHIHSPYALKFLHVCLPFLGKKIIYTRHGAAPFASSHWLKLHKKAQRYVNAITFVSREGSDNFHHQHGWHNIPSFVIDNGVLINPVTQTKSDKLRFGSVGRMIPLKHQISLLQAIALLPLEFQKKIEVNFFGDGECLANLKAFQQKNIADVAVNFHGMVCDRELIYTNIDVLVVTSETEGLSMVIIEAMANNIPVIATDVGGNPKLVINGQTGWLFDYNDKHMLAAYMQRLINNQALIAEYGNNAFTYISENFSIDSAAKKYAELYNA